MTVHRGSISPSSQGEIAGSATYHAVSKLGFSTASKITLKIPSRSGNAGPISLNKEGGLFFSSDKRTFRSPTLGLVYWKGGYGSGFLKMVDGRNKSLVEYKDLRVSGVKMGVMEIYVEMGQEALDEVVVSGMAMLSEERTSMSSVAGSMSGASG